VVHTSPSDFLKTSSTCANHRPVTRAVHTAQVVDALRLFEPEHVLLRDQVSVACHRPVERRGRLLEHGVAAVAQVVPELAPLRRTGHWEVHPAVWTPAPTRQFLRLARLDHKPTTWLKRFLARPKLPKVCDERSGVVVVGPAPPNSQSAPLQNNRGGLTCRS
jgi:hypothetical protein